MVGLTKVHTHTCLLVCAFHLYALMFLRPADIAVTSNPPDLAVKLSYEVMGGQGVLWCVVVWWEDV